MDKNDRSVRPNEALLVQPETERTCNVAMLEHAFSKYMRHFFAKIGAFNAKYPIFVLVLSISVSLGASSGYVLYRESLGVTDINQLWVPQSR